MSDKTLEYRGRNIIIRYAVKRCIHAAECVRGLPRVFDPQRKPWVEVDAAEVEAVVEVIERCPTGALTYERLDDGAREAPQPRNQVSLVADGPMYLRGDLQLEREGQPAERYTRLGLCRCGASENKPFCDGHHARAGFTDPGCLAADAADESPEPAAGVLALKCAPDGPVVFSGQLEIRDAEGRTVVRSQGALCRCGGSANKPFCDGSHRKLGFRG